MRHEKYVIPILLSTVHQPKLSQTHLVLQSSLFHRAPYWMYHNISISIYINFYMTDDVFDVDSFSSQNKLKIFCPMFKKWIMTILIKFYPIKVTRRPKIYEHTRFPSGLLFFRIRSNQEYCSRIESLYLKGQIKSLQAVQHPYLRFLRFNYHIPRD